MLGETECTLVACGCMFSGTSHTLHWNTMLLLSEENIHVSRAEPCYLSMDRFVGQLHVHPVVRQRSYCRGRMPVCHGNRGIL